MTTGPAHHIVAFIIIGILLLYFIRSKIIIISYLITLPLIGEYIQLYIPFNFAFEYVDIIWNYIGVLLSLTIVWVGHSVRSRVPDF